MTDTLLPIPFKSLVDHCLHIDSTANRKGILKTGTTDTNERHKRCAEDTLLPSFLPSFRLHTLLLLRVPAAGVRSITSLFWRIVIDLEWRPGLFSVHSG